MSQKFTNSIDLKVLRQKLKENRDEVRKWKKESIPYHNEFRNFDKALQKMNDEWDKFDVGIGALKNRYDVIGCTDEEYLRDIVPRLSKKEMFKLFDAFYDFVHRVNTVKAAVRALDAKYKPVFRRLEVAENYVDYLARRIRTIRDQNWQKKQEAVKVVAPKTIQLGGRKYRLELI